MRLRDVCARERAGAAAGKPTEPLGAPSGRLIVTGGHGDGPVIGRSCPGPPGPVRLPDAHGHAPVASPSGSGSVRTRDADATGGTGARVSPRPSGGRGLTEHGDPGVSP
ncbi:hypothetical protein [Streptomyces sp. x-80]|uniref:hypothetical protein n=1 Tax=Streptomyces sp. x-80 TaxID=2789282 RepID=UPI00397F309F